jgi:hypothetical protein
MDSSLRQFVTESVFVWLISNVFFGKAFVVHVSLLRFFCRSSIIRLRLSTPKHLEHKDRNESENCQTVISVD